MEPIGFLKQDQPISVVLWIFFLNFFVFGIFPLAELFVLLAGHFSRLGPLG